jgi:flagellar assembly factor FliW
MKDVNMEQEAKLTVETARFGAIEVAADTVLTFPRGLLGMEQLTRFVLMEGGGAFQWMQSMDDPDACFVVIDSEEVITDYEITPNEDDLNVVMGDTPAPAFMALLIVTIPRQNPEMVTANLMAPLLLNLDTKTGVQAVLPERYPVRHPLMAHSQKQELASTG